MNVLQITNTACTDSNQATGVNRMVTQLSRWLEKEYSDVFFSAYLFEGDCAISPLFKSSFRITTPFDAERFTCFVKNNSINVILFNFAGNSMLDFLPEICQIAHHLNIKVIYCLHFMPGFEGYSYGSFEEFVHSVQIRHGFADKFKKMLIANSKPVSTKVIHKLLKKKYETPYQNCDNIVVFTENYIDRFLNIVKGKERSKFTVIPNPLSFDEVLTKQELKEKKKGSDFCRAPD